MHTHRVVEWVDIDAPRSQVFELILNLERRIQLSPLYGVAHILGKSEDFPQPGSSYRVRVTQGSVLEYDTVVTEYIPLRKFAYRLELPQPSDITWSVQEAASGTRVTYEEVFSVSEENQDTVVPAVRQVIHQWLGNIKRYSELRPGGYQRIIKWLLDRFYLRMRHDQRKVVQTVLFMHAVGIISFLMAAIALGIASLF